MGEGAGGDGALGPGEFSRVWMGGRARAVCIRQVRFNGGWWTQSAGQGSPVQGLVLGAVGLGPRDLVLWCGVGHSAQFGLLGLGNVCVTV